MQKKIYSSTAQACKPVNILLKTVQKNVLSAFEIVLSCENMQF